MCLKQKRVMVSENYPAKSLSVTQGLLVPPDYLLRSSGHTDASQARDLHALYIFLLQPCMNRHLFFLSSLGNTASLSTCPVTKLIPPPLFPFFHLCVCAHAVTCVNASTRMPWLKCGGQRITSGVIITFHLVSCCVQADL